MLFFAASNRDCNKPTSIVTPWLLLKTLVPFNRFIFLLSLFFNYPTEPFFLIYSLSYLFYLMLSFFRSTHVVILISNQFLFLHKATLLSGMRSHIVRSTFFKFSTTCFFL